MGVAMPIVMAAMSGAGAISSASGQMRASEENAGYLQQEGRMQAAGYNQNMAAQLRKGAVMMGASTAAAVQSGGGVGGSTKAVLDQSALNANLDALNIRYEGIIRKASYDEQAGIDLDQGKQLATATLIKGIGSAISTGYSLGVGQ